jgi:S-DNA-T family DNA segregation ATPase FtsK/SpoIIIE
VVVSAKAETMRATRSATLAAPADSTARRVVKRNLSAFAGLAGLALAAAVAAALATWAVDDPSFSHATDQGVRNVLGFAGAIASDLLTQLFGLGASLLLVPPVVWAWRVVFAGHSRLSWKTATTWLVGTLAAALALACVPVPGSWPLPTGLGGAAGDILLGIPSLAAGGPLGSFAAFTTCALAATVSLGLLLHACGLIFAGPAAELAAAPAIRVHGRANADDDVDDDLEPLDDDADRPRRLSLLAGLLTHLALRFAGGLRRTLFPRSRGFRRAPPPFTVADRPDLDDGRSEPRLEDEAWYDETDEAGDGSAAAAPATPRRRAARFRRKARPRRRSGFQLPPLDLLAEPRASERKATISPAVLEQNARMLEGVLDEFGVRGEIVNFRPGPVVTLYELEPAPGIKSARVVGLADDIARSMSAISCRVAVIPGKNAIGIELPNPRRETVYLRELLASDEFEQSDARLGLCLGKTIGGEPVIADLTRMPHLLVAGTTGSGKSVSINAMILSLLYQLTPDECRMILIDPKLLELSTYDGIPHLMTPVVTDPKQAVIALKWTVREMEDRYRKMSKLGVRNIDGYNARLNQALSRGETLTRTVQTGFDPDSGEAIYEEEALSLDPMPYIVVIIDEMADLMMVAGKDIEGAVQRLAQMARAAGIHVVMATQRPSVDVITGTIKANFPTRVSFQVTSRIDSRTILGEQGAEQLLGQGDMLYMVGGGRIQRVHGPFVSEEEVDEVVAHLKEQGAPDYLYSITVDDDSDEDGGASLAGADDESNELYDRAVNIVLRDRKASTSYIQRRLSIGYNRAASIIERMEEEGVVGPANHAGKRDILVGDDADGYR